VQNQARASADSEAATAVRVREETQRTALGVAGVAAILSISLILLTVRSLRRRLDLFIHGTRAVSQGKFSFQLDATVGDETGQMARAFNSMVQELAQLERIKADFISSVSHELRTPLVAMLETNNLLLDEVPGPLTAKQKHMLQLNTQATQRLSNMITDLLDLSRLKAGIRYSLSEQDLAQLTQSAVSELEAMALERGIELRAHVGTLLKANCDPDRFVQVVQNLVENALKYTPSRGTVEVSLETKPSKHLPQEALSGDHPRDYALLTVEDSGKGIPEVDRARVFEKFFRREGLPSDGGTGLGLAICREIIEAHGGNIWVSDSKKLGGAALHVAFPIELSPTTKRRHKGSAAA
jgi:signal transduction histidine kinase